MTTSAAAAHSSIKRQTFSAFRIKSAESCSQGSGLVDQDQDGGQDQDKVESGQGRNP
jgi:hypothetical protein